MRTIWTVFVLAGLLASADATFDHYRVTDIGLPSGVVATDQLRSGQYRNNGSVRASMSQQGQNFLSQFIYRAGHFTPIQPPSGEADTNETDWIAYGIKLPYGSGGSRAGYYQNNAFHALQPSAGWNEIGCWGSTETKYMYGSESTGAGPNDRARPYLYEVATGQYTYLPERLKTVATAANDTGQVAVISSFDGSWGAANSYLWKDGQYLPMGFFAPTAMSGNGYVAGAIGFGGDQIHIYKDSLVGVQQIPGFRIGFATGISNDGIASTWMNDHGSCYLASMTDIAKLDDLVVNKPSNMTIYGASINYDGHMFGQAKVGNEHHFVLLDPVPEPATWLVVGVGAVVLLRRKARS